MNTRRSFGHHGFTLIELLMTILIIGILAIVGITQFNNFSTDAKNAATRANLAIMRNAIGVMNAMERVRCGKTSLGFPAVGTLQSDDITGCTNAPAPHAGAVGVLATCNFANLVDPKTGVAYTGGCAADAYSDAHYMSLFPMIDRPFIQNTIPDNPWQASSEVLLFASTVTADTPNVANPGGPCVNAPANIAGAQVNGKACAQAATAYGTPATDGGWCYCVGTGQIWPNTGNNDGLNAGTGGESLF
jgi:prepilin-type N-terminal cleavage/methylation domain-containing protein